MSFDPALVSGKQSRGLKGQFTVDEGLQKVLERTKLHAVEQSKNSYLVMSTEVKEGEEVNLDVINIEENKASGLSERTGLYTVDETHSATGLNLSARDTPQSLSVMTRQRMDDQALENTVDVLEQTPGIVINHDDGERYNIISRGGQITQYQLDGVPISTESVNQLSPLAMADMAIYDHIEVVRGATGLMTGAGVPGGVVSLIRKRPTQEFQASLQGGVGRWNDYRGELDISGPLTESGNIRGRFVAAKQDKDSFTRYYGQEKEVLYGVIEADLTDSTLVRFGLDYQNTTWDGKSGVPLFYRDGSQARLPRSTSMASSWTEENQETYNYTFDIEQQLSHDWVLNVTANYMESEADKTFASLVNYFYQTVDPSTNEAALVTNGHWDKEQTQKGFNIDLQGPFTWLGREHEAVLGMNYSSYENRYRNYGETISANVALDELNTLRPRDKLAPSLTPHFVHQRGYYAALRINPVDRWHVILGARSSDYAYETYNIARTTGVKSRESKYQENGEVTPYAGIVFDITPQQSVYASYTDIFSPNSVVDRNMQVLEPEIGSNYELGWKGAFYDDRLTANVAVYEIKRENVAEYVGDVSGVSVYETISGVETQGIDIELSGELLPDWNISASYSHSRSENADGERELTQYPLDTVKVFTTYQLPGNWRQLTIGGGINWYGKTSAENTYISGKAEQEAYTVVNAMARYQFTPQLSGMVNVGNLFDKTYYSSINTYGFGYYGEPRNVKLSLRYDF